MEIVLAFYITLSVYVLIQRRYVESLKTEAEAAQFVSDCYLDRIQDLESQLDLTISEHDQLHRDYFNLKAIIKEQDEMIADLRSRNFKYHLASMEHLANKLYSPTPLPDWDDEWETIHDEGR